MNRPCSNRDICPGSEFPVTNFSSEAPDIFTFRQLRYPIFPPGDPLGPGGGGGGHGDPPIYLAVACQTVCESTISQEDADLCAQRLAQTCLLGGGGNQVFFNNSQICVLPCGPGSNFFWIVAAGEFTGATQAAADEQAMAYACLKAAQNAFCLSDIPATADIGILYSGDIIETGAAVQPVSFAVVAGTLPDGLNLLPNTDISSEIRGIPTKSGTFNFTIRATDARGVFVQRDYTITIASTCAWFNNLLWTNPPVLLLSPSFPNSGSASITYPALNQVQLDLQATMVGAGQTADADNSATVTCPTEALTCTVTMNVKISSGVNFVDLTIRDADTLVILLDTTVLATPPVGITTFTLTKPAGVIHLLVEPATQAGQNFVNGQLSVNFQFG